MSDRSPGVWLPADIVRIAPSLPAAVLLAQLLWLLDRQNAATIVDLDGHHWIERADTAWESVGLAKQDAYRARRALEREELLFVRQTTNAAGKVTLLRPNLETIASTREHLSRQRDKGVSRQRDKGVSRQRDKGVSRQRDKGCRANATRGVAPTRHPDDASPLAVELEPKQEPSSSVAFGDDVESTGLSATSATDDKGASTDDVDRLCLLLAELVESNGSKRPAITDRWRVECERLIRLDGHPVEAVERAIRWSQADPFWRGNVLSMPALRRQYDRLRLHAKRDVRGPGAVAQPVGQDAVEAYFEKRGLFDERSTSVVETRASEVASA